MRPDDIKNPRTKNYSFFKYQLILAERFVKAIFYLFISYFNFGFFKAKNKIFIENYKDVRFINFLFFSLKNDFQFIYEPSWNFSKFIKKIGLINFFLVCKKGRRGQCKYILSFDKEDNLLEKNSINFNSDYFFLSDNPTTKYKSLPYYLYPKVYNHSYNLISKYHNLEKDIKILFSGTTNEKLYKDFQWIKNGKQMPNRHEILNYIEREFEDCTAVVTKKEQFNLNKKDYEIFLYKNLMLNKKSKALLTLSEHLKLVSRSNFFITAPGTGMPICHHIIEAMKFGSIPITNYGDLIYPNLNSEISLSYNDLNELKHCINVALKMSKSEIARMQMKLKKFYLDYFSPKSFSSKILNITTPITFYANNDHDSVDLRNIRMQK